jgi:hypothetical protein
MFERTEQNRRGAADLRQPLEPGDQLFDRLVACLTRGIAFLAQSTHREGEHVTRIETKVLAVQSRETPEAQTGCQQQHQRACDLHPNQPSPCAGGAGALHDSGRSALEFLDHRRAAQAKRRAQSDREGRNHGADNGKNQHGRVN